MTTASINHFVSTLFLLIMLITSAMASEEDKQKQVTGKVGYTQKFQIPENGLSSEEREYLSILAQINDVLSEEVDLTVIANRVEPLLSFFWGDLTSTAWKIEIATGFDPDNSGVRGIKRIGSIMFRHPGVLLQRREIYYVISGKDWANPDAPSKYIQRIMLLPIKESNLGLSISFHRNGAIQNFVYINALGTKVKREITWSEDGELIQERTITKPEPLIFWRAKPNT